MAKSTAICLYIAGTLRTPFSTPLVRVIVVQGESITAFKSLASLTAGPAKAGPLTKRYSTIHTALLRRAVCIVE
ncbi:hypothetical protein OF001_U440002 [Pseudomonas sp. OF001]|nr:hypothetical protein OF001_U440002 [Pseudomonas sp. OF001]